MTVQGLSDNKTLAMLAVCAGVALASTQDALVKWVSGNYPVHEALTIRGLVAGLIVLAMVWRSTGLAAMLTPEWPRTLLRGAILCSAYMAFTLSIAAMPIANTVAIYFTMPFFVAALSWPVLGERVRFHRWLAIIAGFVGIMVMIRPGRGVFEPAAFFALYSAFGYALGQMLGRDIARTVSPTVMAFYQNFVYLAVALLLALLCNTVDFGGVEHKSLSFLLRAWIYPKPADLVLMAALGVLASVAMVQFSIAYKHAEASFVAPFEYSAMFWAVTYGLILFGDFPGLPTAIGGAIVIAAGLFMLWMDRRVLPVQTG
jgi:drug/metabolite transporter (DMT)-like permease